MKGTLSNVNIYKYNKIRKSTGSDVRLEMFFGVTSAHWPCGDRVLITCCSVLDGCWYGTKTKHSPWFYKKNTQYNVINKHTKDKNQKKTKYKQLFFRLDMQCFQKSILFFKIAPYHIDWFSKKFHSNKV